MHRNRRRQNNRREEVNQAQNRQLAQRYSDSITAKISDIGQQFCSVLAGFAFKVLADIKPGKDLDNIACAFDSATLLSFLITIHYAMVLRALSLPHFLVDLPAVPNFNNMNEVEREFRARVHQRRDRFRPELVQSNQIFIILGPLSLLGGVVLKQWLAFSKHSTLVPLTSIIILAVYFIRLLFKVRYLIRLGAHF